MSMTMADKEKCAEIYEIYTGGIHTEPAKWNERAADLLAKMVFDIERCTRGLAAARAVWPINIKVGWGYLVKVVYHIIKGEAKLRQGYVHTACLDISIGVYKSSIHYELEK